MKNIEKGSGNVYADLGISDADEMFVKAQLAAKIADVIKLQKISQTRAAIVLGISQPKLFHMLRGHFHGISEFEMLQCLTRLGFDVQIVIKAKSRTRKAGRLSVRFA